MFDFFHLYLILMILFQMYHNFHIFQPLHLMNNRHKKLYYNFDLDQIHKLSLNHLQIYILFYILYIYDHKYLLFLCNFCKFYSKAYKLLLQFLHQYYNLSLFLSYFHKMVLLLNIHLTYIYRYYIQMNNLLYKNDKNLYIYKYLLVYLYNYHMNLNLIDNYDNYFQNNKHNDILVYKNYIFVYFLNHMHHMFHMPHNIHPNNLMNY